MLLKSSNELWQSFGVNEGTSLLPQVAGNTAEAEVTVRVKWISWPQSGAYEDISYTLQTQSRPLTVGWPKWREEGIRRLGRETVRLQVTETGRALSCSDTDLLQSQAVGSFPALAWGCSEVRVVSENGKRMSCLVVLKGSTPSAFPLIRYQASSPQPALQPHVWQFIVFLFNLTGQPPETLAWLVVANICTCLRTIFFKK